MRALITVGLGFGDEGKGATIDYLARRLSAELVVRYCGGAQAGHNVQLADGRRHTFAQFGAGTLAGARTHLGPRMIINPATMVPEAEHLRELGVADPWALLTVDPEALAATSYHVYMNRLREAARGSGRHGSCGIGIGETRHYWLRYGRDAVAAADLHDRPVLIEKLRLARDRLLLEMQELSRIDREYGELLHDTWPAEEADLLQEAAAALQVTPALPAVETALFEGAQGVLLDEWKGFHPHTTWSTVTPLHAWEMLSESKVKDVKVLGITRAYTTRHGMGPFPTECSQMSAEIVDPGNPENDWQGAIRSGPLDMVLLKYAARICQVDGLVVTGLDQLPAVPQIADRYENCEQLSLPRSLAEQAALTEQLEQAKPILRETTADDILETLETIAPVLLTSDGPTAADRTEAGDWLAPRESTAG